MIEILSHKQGELFLPQMSNKVWEAGSGNWRDMLMVWFWEAGIRADPAKLSGWGKIYCYQTKALETGSSRHIERSGDSSANTQKGLRREWDSCLLPALSRYCYSYSSTDLFWKWTLLLSEAGCTSRDSSSRGTQSDPKKVPWNFPSSSHTKNKLWLLGHPVYSYKSTPMMSMLKRVTTFTKLSWDLLSFPESPMSNTWTRARRTNLVKTF